MAVGKTSRPKKEFNNMLVGLGNITDKQTENKAIDPVTPVKETVPEEKTITNSSLVVNETKSKLDIDAVQLVQVVDKSNMGRPKVLTGVYKPISTRLKLENLEYAKKISGIYGGLTGFLNWLIEEDKKRRFGE